MSDREAFEHWYAGHTGDPHIRHYCDSIGRYQFNSMQSAWQAWQAAQAQAGDGEAVGYVYHTSGGAREVSWFCTDDIDDDTLLYLLMQPAQPVNQQLLEGWEIKKVDADGFSFLVTHPDGSGILLQDGQPGIMAHMFIELCEAIAAAQERK